MRYPSVFIDPAKSKDVELNYILSKVFYQPRGYYQSAKKLWSKAKEEKSDISLSDVEKWLRRQAVWQIHSPPPRYIPQASFNKITRPNEYHQADILYMPYDKVRGKEYKYCLNIVDVASRYKASVPLIDRSSVSVAKAFKRVYNYNKNCPLILPKVLQVDGGSEFMDKVVKVMKQKGVRIRVGTSHKHQSIVERFNRTLAEKLFRIQDARELVSNEIDTAWVENLQTIVDDLNNSVTRLLGISPAEAIHKDEVYASPSKIHKSRPVGEDEVRLPAGTLVRYLLDNSEFIGKRRATDPIWSKKIFTIESSTVISGQPVMYRLVDGPKKIFMREELLEVPSDTMLPPTYLL